MISEGVGASSCVTPFSTENDALRFGKLLIQSGTISVKTTGATNASGARKYWGRATLTFPISYSSAPNVISNILDVPRYWYSSVRDITASSANIDIGGDANNATRTVNWIAVGFKE